MDTRRKQITRRKFLRLLGMTGVGVTLASCGGSRQTLTDQLPEPMLYWTHLKRVQTNNCQPGPLGDEFTELFNRTP